MKVRFQQLKRQLHVQDKHLLMIGGALGVSIGAYAAYRYFLSNKQKDAAKIQVEQQKSFSQTYKQAIKSVQQSISRHKALNGQVIKCILKNQYKLAHQQYKECILKFRDQRRRLMREKSEYGKLISTVSIAMEQLMDKNLNAILAHFSIDKTHWIQTVELWSSDSQQNKQQWQNMLVELDNGQLDSLRDPKKKALSVGKLEQIFRFKIHTLRNLHQSGLDLDANITDDDEPDLNAKHALIQKYLDDLVFNKFGAQEEDILYSQNQLSQQDKEKVFTIQDQFTELIRIQIFGDEESAEETQENKQLHEQGRLIESGVEAACKPNHQAEQQDQDQYF